MPTYIDIDGDANELTGKGALLHAVGETFKGQIQAILGDIRAVEAERPWGSDKYGVSFDHSYNQVPEGSDTCISQGTCDSMGEAGDALTRNGRRIIFAMTEIQGEDDQGAAEIRRAV